MTQSFIIYLAIVVLIFPTAVAAQSHPDLSGTWANVSSLPPDNLTRQVNGAVSKTSVDRGVVRLTAVPGALNRPGRPRTSRSFRKK